MAYTYGNKKTGWDPSLSTAHISSSLHNYEAARSGFFVFEIDPSDFDLIRPDVSADQELADLGENDVFAAASATERIRLNVVKASVPTFDIKIEEYRRGNDVVKFAGIPTFSDGSIVVDDVVGLNTKSILYSWLYQAYNPNTRKGGRMADYKHTCTLMEYTQDYDLIRTWTLDGCWINKLDEAEFDRENDSKRQITASIVFDRATMKDADSDNE